VKMKPVKSKWMLGSIGFLVFVLAIILAALRARPEGDFFERPSTYFADKTGSKAVFLVLEHFLPEVHRLRRPFRFWNSDEAGSLVIIQPGGALVEKDASALLEWVDSGGQLILVTSEEWQFPLKKSTWNLFGNKGQADQDDDSSAEDASDKAAEPSAEDTQEEIPLGFFTELGLRITDDASGFMSEGQLVLRPAILEGEEIEALLMDGDTLLAGQLQRGAGRVVIVPDGHAFSNQRLVDSQNAAWLVQLCLSWEGPVWFDELHHGFSDQASVPMLIVRFLGSPWGFAFVQLLVAGCMLVFGPWRRFGSILEPKPVHRHEPLELIHARAGLFRQAGARVLSFQMIHRFFARTLQANRPRHNLFEDEAGVGPIFGGARFQRYLTLYRQVRDSESLSETEFVEAARLAGEILEEYQNERN